LLGTAAEGYQQNRLMAAQVRNFEAEAAAREAQTAARKIAMERLAQFRQAIGGASLGAPEAPVPAVQPTVPAQPAVPAEVLKFAPSGSMAKPSTAAAPQEVPESVGTFLQSAKPFAMPKAQPVAQPPVALVAPKVSAPSLEGGLTLEQRQNLVRSGMPMEFVAAIPQQVPMQSVALAYEEMLLQQSEGKPVTAGTFIGSLQKQEQLRRQGLGESRELTLDEGLPLVQNFNQQQMQVSPELRQFATLEPTNRAGYYSFKTQKAGLTPQEERSKAQQQSELEARQKMLTENYSEVRKQAADDRQITPQIRKLKSLYEGGKIEGKAFDNIKAGAISILKGLNFDVGADLEAAQESTNLGQALMNNLIVPYFNSLKGSTSNRDVDLIKSFGPQLTTNPKAALAMLEIMERRVEYNKAVDRQYTLFSAGRLSSSALADKLIELQDKFEASIPEQSAFAQQFNLTASTTAPGSSTTGTTRSSVAGGTYTIQGGKLVPSGSKP
jgi:hypothetical protein